MLKNYIKIAFRNLWRHKFLTSINVIGLSIGISAALVIYLIVHFDLSFDKFHKNGDRIYRVVTNFTFSGDPAFNPGVCGPLPGAVKTQVTGLEVSAPILKLFQPDVYINKDQPDATRFKAVGDVIFADNNYFSIFKYEWLAGSERTSLSEPFQVVLTSDQADKYFPNIPYSQVLGKVLVYDSLKTTVTGVIKPFKQNSDLTFHDFISYSTCFANSDLKSGLRLHNWGGTSVKSQLFVKLFADTKPSSIEKQLNDILRTNNPPTPETKNKTQAFHLQPLSNIHFNPDYTVFGRQRVANKNILLSLLAIAIFILLLGCINFINLTTAQAVQRAKEIGIRKTMGSSRSQLITQFLSETFVVTLSAVLLAVVLAPILLRLFSGFIPQGIDIALLDKPNVIIFLTILTPVVSLLSGFYPAMILSGYKPVSVLKNQAQNGTGKSRNALLRKTLIVTQFVIAQFFIMATIMVSKQIYYALHKDLGIKKDAIVVVNSPFKNRDAKLNLVYLNKLRSIPQVEMVSAGNDEPMSENTSSTEAVYRNGKTEIKSNPSEKFGDENYIKLYHIKLLAGRNLQPADLGRAFLVNETYTKIMGFKNPADAVGKQIDNFNGNDQKMQIIGVVADFHQESLHAAIQPLVILTPTDKDFSGVFHIALKPQTAGGNEWSKAIATMKTEWKQIYPDDDFNFQFFDQTIAQLYETDQHTSTLLTWATGISIFISCLGLLGLTIFTTGQRTKEIGVRKVLGATVTQIVAILTRELVWLTALAFVLVTPVAWYAINQWMQGYADRTTISWWIFAASGIGMLIAAIFTSGFQTVKAALANPINSLRSE